MNSYNYLLYSPNRHLRRYNIMDQPKTSSTTDQEKKQSSEPSVESSDTKTKQTVPTLNPDIEFINRTLP